jgi:hypothetical protein
VRVIEHRGVSGYPREPIAAADAVLLVCPSQNRFERRDHGSIELRLDSLSES